MTDLVPLFPLGTVLFPGLVLPLHVFEERYRRLVADLEALPAGQARRFGVVAIRAGREVGQDGVRALHEVGCMAEVRTVKPYADGRFDLVTVGGARFRLTGVDAGLPYLRGHVDWLDDRPGAAAGAALARGVARLFTRYRAALLTANGQPEPAPPDLPEEPLLLSYVVAAATILDVPDKQRLLAAPDAAARLRLELAMLRRETTLLSLLPSLPAVEFLRAPVHPN